MLRANRAVERRRPRRHNIRRRGRLRSTSLLRIKPEVLLSNLVFLLSLANSQLRDNHSYLSARIGSRRAADSAGMIAPASDVAIAIATITAALVTLKYVGMRSK